MERIIGIRREDKNIWEKRTPLVPEDLKELAEKYNIKFIVQSSKIRAFSDEEYKKVGAEVTEDLNKAEIILAIKEIPKELFEKDKIYIFFSHTIKGQKHNMPMLKEIINKGATLIDYERIVDDKGRRLIFFGKFAGYSGMIDTLWALGERLNYEKIEPNPFIEIKQTYKYKDLSDAKEAIKELRKKIEKEGLPKELTPFIIGFAGYGNVSQGAQSIIDVLPIEELSPSSLKEFFESKSYSNKKVYKVVFKEEDMVEPIDKSIKFELYDYYNHPEKYKGRFEIYLPYIKVLINAIYWESKYPRLVTKKWLKENWRKEKHILKVIGDISCDIEGAIECTVKATSPDNPVFVYEVSTGKIIDGVKGDGPVILAVDNLPCELPIESSKEFSSVLKRFIPEIAKADFTKSFEQLELSPEIKRAIIVYHGKLTPNYEYLNKYLE